MYVMKPLYTAVANHFQLADYATLGVTLLLAGVTTIVSFLSAVVLLLMDRRLEAHEKTEEAERRNQHGYEPLMNEFDDERPGAKPPAPDTIRMKDIAAFPITFWLICAICVLFYVAIFPFVSFGL